MTRSWIWVFSIVIALPSAALSQTGAIGGFSTNPRSPSTAYYEPFPRSIPGITLSAPYYGEEVVDVVHTLPDGSLMKTDLSGRKVWRDSQGRIRVERLLGTRTIVEITDPVAEFWYALDTENRVAHREKLPSSMKPRPASYYADSPNAPDSLGKQVVEGQLAEGRKTRFEKGKTVDGRPVYFETEIWIARDLKIAVLSKHSDPIYGAHTNRTININRAEPEAKLFDVPSDYKIVDETRPYEIRFSNR